MGEYGARSGAAPSRERALSHADFSPAVDGGVAGGALRKLTWRLIPFLGVLYFAAFIDRVNVGFAALQMNRDLGFSAYVYGLGSGIFFVGYCLLECRAR